MIFYRNRLIFGAVKKIISIAMKAVYAIISVFNLQFTLLVAVVGLVLFFTGVLKDSAVAKIILLALLGFSVLYAFLTTIVKLFGLEKTPKKRRGGVQVSSGQSSEPAVVETGAPPVGAVQIQTQEQPKYYRVKQNQNMIMAEYQDRYELFDVSGGAMIKIRTDYK